MSLVGPRPAIPYEVAAYETWHRRRVLEVKPGITGSWQVNGRSRVRFDEMVRLDLQYARSWSPWLDINDPHAHTRARCSVETAHIELCVPSCSFSRLMQRQTLLVIRGTPHAKYDAIAQSSAVLTGGETS